jgi:hypothetical protein
MLAHLDGTGAPSFDGQVVLPTPTLRMSDVIVAPGSVRIEHETRL